MWKVPGHDPVVIPTAIRPLVLNRTLYANIQRVAESTVSLCSKALDVVFQDPELLDSSDLTADDLRLADESLFNNRKMPEITRVDMTLHKGNIRVFEINTHSPVGMVHLDKLNNYQESFCRSIKSLNELNYSLQGDCCRAVRDVLLDSWRDFLSRSASKYKTPRAIAIMEKDWTERPTASEFKHFRDKILKSIAHTEIVEPTDLISKEKGLFIKRTGQPIDLVYKRMLWQHASDADEVKHAYENNKVCVVNSFRTGLVGNKFLLSLLSDPSFLDRVKKSDVILEEHEKQILENGHIPHTRYWGGDEKLRGEVLRDITRYVIKSFRGIGSYHVKYGDREMATDKFREKWKKDYVVQERLQHGVTEIPLLKGNILHWIPHFFIIGAYVIGGKCIALEAKVSMVEPITMYFHQGKPRGHRTAVFCTK
jgi:uncharacterized circularly permuted ATP-grasp superfamily protein